MPLSQLTRLNASEWVVATVLPDGIEYLYPLAGGGGLHATRSGTGLDVPDRANEQLAVSSGIEEPLGSGEAIDIDGDIWTVSALGIDGWSAARPVGTDVVSVRGRGKLDNLARAVLAGLAVVPESALPSLPLGPPERAVEVATTDLDGLRYSLAIQESNGFACTRVSSTDGSAGGCGSLIDPSTPIEIIGGSSTEVEESNIIEVASAGTVTKSATAR